MTVTETAKPMMKRKGLLAIVLIAIALIAAGLAYYAYQSQNKSTSAAPTVLSTAPIHAATGSPTNTTILVTFSTAMDPTPSRPQHSPSSTGPHLIPAP